MRITTKVIQGNSIHNINNNKVMQDKLNNQMSTEKKIVRPSDDPVVAIRALRLRTNVSQVTQFYEKNAPDAESWMKVTEDSLTTVSSVLTDMIEQCTKGSSEKLTATDRNTILDALKALRDEVYATGNADYAGRSVFTGYRTETTLKYTASEERKFEITEQLNSNALDSITYINSSYLNGLNEVNFSSGSYTPPTGGTASNTDIVEQNITESQIHRIRLAYDNLDNIDPSKLGIKLYAYNDPTKETLPLPSFDGSNVYYIKNSSGEYELTTDTAPDSATQYYSRPAKVADRYVQMGSVDIEVVSQNDIPNPYQKMVEYDTPAEETTTPIDFDPNKTYYEKDSYGNFVQTSDATPDATKTYYSVSDHAILIPETGELLVSRTVYDKMMKLTDDVRTPDVDESQIQITYNKTTWKKDDLKPEHYFACTDMSDADPLNHINYNTDYLSGIVEKQAIEYDVGINQSIRVNTTADEVFTHAIGRDIDDLVSSMQEVVDMTETIDRLTGIRDKMETSDPNYQIITRQIDAANKALTYLKEKNQKLFEGGITRMQGHLDKVNEATTACGTREKKLFLIKNRLMSQKTNFETLESENENVEITDVALQLKGAELTYQAALMSTSKILQTSLMNYL